MQELTERALLLATPAGLFDMTVVTNLSPDASEGARKALVHRAVRASELIRLQPGLFLLQPAFRKSDPTPTWSRLCCMPRPT